MSASRRAGVRGARLAGLALALSLAAAPAAAAKLYKWVDENGQTQFADRPPADRPPGEVEAVDAPRAFVPTGSGEEKLRDSFQPEPPEGESPDYKGDAPPEPEERYTCAQARSYVTIHEENLTKEMYAPEHDGSFKPLARADVEGMLAAWQAVAERVCGGEGGGETAGNASGG